MVMQQQDSLCSHGASQAVRTDSDHEGQNKATTLYLAVHFVTELDVT